MSNPYNLSERIDDIGLRLDALKPGGPWTWTRLTEDGGSLHAGGSDGIVYAACQVAGLHLPVEREAVAEFIESAPTDIEWLLRVANAARRLVDPPQGWGRMPAEMIDLIDVLRERIAKDGPTQEPT